jgi:hypothetical protein
MPVRCSFDFAVVRVVPRVERGEFVNAGVIVYCQEQRYLAARVMVDAARLEALWPGLDVEALREQLEAIPRVCAGEGPVGKMLLRERFAWLVAPRSTVVQVSAVHSGICSAPQERLEDLFRQLVLLPEASGGSLETWPLAGSVGE